MKRPTADLSFHEKIDSLLIAGFCMLFGLLIFKFLPMRIFGEEILFDASMHITTVIFVLYVFWYFVDQDKNLRIVYLFLAFMILVIVSVQRIYSDAHNDVGLLAGLVISLTSIIFSRWKYFNGKFSF